MATIDPHVQLQRALADLDNALAELALLAGDVPEDDEPAIVDALRDRVSDVRGDIADAASALRDHDGLAMCHERFNVAASRIASELTTRAHIVEIASIAIEREGAWTKWSDAVQQGLDRCTSAHDTVAAALLGCWRETHRVA